MDILILQVFVSLFLVVSSVILFGFTCRSRSFDHSDRLALLPVADDGPDSHAPRQAAGADKDSEGTEL